METVIHRAGTRGVAEHGWLSSRHTFSFAGYLDPDRMHFGLLRVINDDVVQPGKGFGMHPHDNMEIVSIPLSGALRHEDTLGNRHLIRAGEVQIMSAGSGLRHSEYNASDTAPVNFLQIWVFPKLRDIPPRYDQQRFAAAGHRDRFQTIVAPDGADGAVRINQDAWFSIGDFSAGADELCETRLAANGIYLFVIDGFLSLAGTALGPRDGIGIAGVRRTTLHADSDCRALLIEVPMQ